MTAVPERQLLWHPRGLDKFIIGGGSQITLYEWSSDEPAIRHVTSQQDLQSMKVSLYIGPHRRFHNFRKVFCMVTRLKH